ncbi:MAG: phosphatase PAP2 family protein [Ferrovibrio sp.]|uniref:phosphatase PAP2 family protein n=1 Tax=Ferrovibrio sp. TaxID=1917215 RepID=UPI00261DC9EA|nr:phosphatase PAP2 family protein [Ferrovibrio sp.]MCW0234327.1 phosphatase PAP2 family protein [Ferrovibrio sp.]
MPHPLSALLTRLGRFELPLLVLPGVAALALWGFVALADEILEGETGDVDRRLLLSLRNPQDLSNPLGPLWLEEMMRDVTAFGGTGPLAFITAACILYLLLRRRRRSALFLFAAIAGGQLMSTLLKAGFERPRPDLVPHGMTVYTASFPSGHAMMTAIVYLTLAALLARSESRKRLKAFLLLLAVCVTLLVGVSRVYLGVHWPSDVLGGWMIGSAWAAGCWSLVALLQRRGDVEGEPAADSDT